MPSRRHPSLRLLAPAGLLAPLLLVGCGSDTEVDSPADLAESIECEGFEEVEAPGTAEEAGVCQVVESPIHGLEGPEQITLLTFAEAGEREEFVSGQVDSGRVFVVDDTWAVEVESEEAAALVQEHVGGETQIGTSEVPGTGADPDSGS